MPLFIKFSQPGILIKIYISNSNSDRLKKYSKQILEELNIKKIEYTESEKDIVSYLVKPNFAVIGEQFGDNKSDVIVSLTASNGFKK